MKLCRDCKHFINKGEGSMIWYDLYCGHPKNKLPETIDPVTGHRGYTAQNDLGNTIISNTPYPHARKVNVGNCRLWEK